MEMNTKKFSIDFSGLIRLYHAQALIHLGVVKNPLTDNFEKNLEQAQLLIDILLLLEEKTANNLNREERVMLRESLNRLQTEIKKELN